MKNPESEVTSSDFSEVETKNELRNRMKQNKPTDKTPEVKPKREPPQYLRSMPFMIKYENFIVRTIWTIVMLGGFMGVIKAGHFYCSIIVVLVEIGAFKEILELKRNKEKESQIPVSVLLNWYFFLVGNFYFTFPQIAKLPGSLIKNSFLATILKYHTFTAFSLWVAGFLAFVLSLKQGFYKYQFRRFGWTHITIMIIVVPASCILSNIYNGLIWFVFPALLVIFNDIFAYIFGFTMGKHKLIELSPKKTWEGFIGGLVSTLFIAFFLSNQFAKMKSFICPQDTLTLIPFQEVDCEIPLVFQKYNYSIWGATYEISDFQFHCLIFSLFASLIAPFGGFFASGLKRAIKVKDFAEMIPGHGGITDRMDCQFLTGLFIFLYYNQFIFRRLEFINGVTGIILTELSLSEKLSLFNDLRDNLISLNALNNTIGA